MKYKRVPELCRFGVVRIGTYDTCMCNCNEHKGAKEASYHRDIQTNKELSPKPSLAQASYSALI
jgi:hypothetical protein